MDKLTFKQLKDSKDWKEAVIVFTENSFTKPYMEEQRSYKVSSDAKYFDGSKIGNSLFGNCLDGTDNGVRLDHYMRSDEGKWIVEYCYLIAK